MLGTVRKFARRTLAENAQETVVGLLCLLKLLKLQPSPTMSKGRHANKHRHHKQTNKQTTNQASKQAEKGKKEKEGKKEQEGKRRKEGRKEGGKERRERKIIKKKEQMDVA